MRDSEPVFSPPPVIAVDVKLDADEGPRPEVDLADFVLRAEWCRLMDLIDEFQTATIERIEIRVGIPRRAIFKVPLPEAFATDRQLTTRTAKSAGGRERSDFHEAGGAGMTADTIARELEARRSGPAWMAKCSRPR